MSNIVRPHATAIWRSPRGSVPARKVVPFIAEAQKTHSIFDYGCGHGSDVDYYLTRGYEAAGYDSYAPFGYATRPTTRFDLITVLYVLNVLPSRDERLGVLSDATRFLEPRGVLLVVTRSAVAIERKAAENGWLSHADGYWSSPLKGTFQHGLDEFELLELCSQVDLEAHPLSDRLPIVRGGARVLVRPVDQSCGADV